MLKNDNSATLAPVNQDLEGHENSAKPKYEKLEKQYSDILLSVKNAEALKVSAITLGSQARASKHRAAAEAYMFWRAAKEEPNYLEALYEEKGIAYNKLKRNSPNFNPFVRLVYGELQKDDGWIVSMAKSLNGIDDEFVNNPEVYRNDPVQRLSVWIGVNRGLSGIRSGVEDPDSSEPNTVAKTNLKEPKTTSRGKYQEPPTKIRQDILRTQNKQIKEAKGKTLPLSDLPISDDNSTLNDLVVLLVKRDAKGAYIYLGSTNERSIVEKAVTLCVNVDHSTLSPILGTLAEALTPHQVPKPFVIMNNRKKFFAKHRVKAKDGKDSALISAYTRLVILKNGDILVSKVHGDASLITISQPKRVKLDSDTTIALRATDRHYLETQLLVDGQIMLCSSEPKNNLEDVPEDRPSTQIYKAVKRLTLSSEHLEVRPLYFQDYGQMKATQPTIKQPKEIIFDFAMRASGNLISKVLARSLSPWMANIKNGLGSSGNTAVRLVFTGKDLEVQSKWLKDKEVWDRTRCIDSQCATDFGVNEKITFLKQGAKSYTIVINPHDIIELFNTLSKVRLIGGITIKGNQDLLCFSWETNNAKHTAYIPSSNIAGHRNAKHFEALTNV